MISDECSRNLASIHSGSTSLDEKELWFSEQCWSVENRGDELLERDDLSVRELDLVYIATMCQNYEAEHVLLDFVRSEMYFCASSSET